MYASPASLQKICIDCVISNKDKICRFIYSEDDTNPSTKLAFKNQDVYLHSDISEQLLIALCDKNQLSDVNLTLFDAKYMRLRNVRLNNAHQITRRGLKVLKGHCITELEATNLRITVNDLILCLGDWTLQNLKALNVAKCSFLELDSTRYCVVVALSKLRSLHCLNVSYTEFNSHGLGIVCEDLPQLEALDISNTNVDDLSHLRKCKDRLKSLSIYNLKISSSSVIPVLLDLKELRFLDWSEDPEGNLFQIFPPMKVDITEFFIESGRCLPNLVSLDVSGKKDVTITDIKVFLDSHPNACFLGLLYGAVSYADRFMDSRHEQHNPRLVIAGGSCEVQLLESLKRYSIRPFYVEKILYNLFRLSQGYSGLPRVGLIEAVIKGMSLHRTLLGVQTAATACLYNLTNREVASKIHPSILENVVENTMQAMENFPKNFQMQKNALLTLCSDRILQDVEFDKYRCARLALCCLCNFDDPLVSRMSVAICSILAAKICTSETHRLGSQPHFMRKLLEIVKTKVENRSVDITIKFTLSALWNLTDESPSTCKVFLEQGGMELFLSVLTTFAGECALETKVLGLINNIAEVADLRQKLMIPEFLIVLRKLLVNSKHIDVSYFAAGIVAHLASEDPDDWTITEVDRNVLLDELAKVVLEWGLPEGEMVAYRSFHPFFPLLSKFDAYQIQLWAAWAIQHVCAKNAKKYCPMLVEEGGYDIIKKLSTDPKVHQDVRSICNSILQLR